MKYNMKKTIITIALAAISLLATAQETTRTYSFGDIERISAGSTFEIYVTEGDSDKVEVVFEKGLEKYIDIRYSELRSELSIWMKELPRKLRTEEIPSVKVYVTMDYIASIDLSGAASMCFEGEYGAKNLDIELSGASSLEDLRVNGQVLSIDCSGAAKGYISGNFTEKVDLVCSGAGRIMLEGKGNTVRLDGSGAADIDTKDFMAENVTVDLSGAGKAKVYASKELRYDVGFACKLTYFGEADAVNVSRDANVIKGGL